MLKTRLLGLFALLYLIPSICSSQNPYLPPTAFIPDGEPHVFTYKGETRLYVYGSRDERVTSYCGYGLDVWSAPVNDLTSWTNHGEIFNVKEVQDIGYGKVPEQHFGAPDCVYNPVTKKYYVYVFLGAVYHLDGKEGPLKSDKNTVPGYGDYGPKCVVAESDAPYGPFVNPVMCDWIPANDRGTFDPSVLVDQQEDGSVKVYAYWGMVNGDRYAQLDPNDMHTVINPATGKPDRNAVFKTLPDKSQINGSSLFEASSIKKVAKDKYVFIYSPNEGQSKLTYCYGNSPKGPWKFGGRIVDNCVGWRFGNNHGSIVNVKGKWYVVFHRSSDSDFSRQSMMEPIHLTIEGDKVVIPQVPVTSQGVQVNGLDPLKRYYAGIMCWRNSPSICIQGSKRFSDGMNPVANIVAPKSILGYKYFNFKNKVLKANLFFTINLSLLQDTKFTLHLSTPEDVDKPDKWVTVAQVDLHYSSVADADFHDVKIPVSNLKKAGILKSGKYAAFLTFESEKGGELCKLKEIEFSTDKEKATPNPLRKIQVKDESDKGTVAALPTAGRGGESVIVRVYLKEGYKLDRLIIKDEQSRTVKTVENGRPPHAPQSFHFTMPKSGVTIEPVFIK
jgi:hypothetical protein